MSGLANFAKGRGTIGQDFDDLDLEAQEEAPCKYFHIQACGPGGIAEADASFAKRILLRCIRVAKKDPVGIMKWPVDFTVVSWAPGEINNTGGAPYEMPFNLDIVLTKDGKLRYDETADLDIEQAQDQKKIDRKKKEQEIERLRREEELRKADEKYREEE